MQISHCSNPSPQPSDACPEMYSFRLDSSTGVSAPATRHSATPQSWPFRSSTVNTADWTFRLTLSSSLYQCISPRSISSGIRYLVRALRMGPSYSRRDRPSSWVQSSSMSPYSLRVYRSAVRGIYSFRVVSSGGITEKLSSPMISARPLPLSQFIWNWPISSMYFRVPVLPGGSGAYGSFISLSLILVPAGNCSRRKFSHSLGTDIYIPPI